MMIWDTSHSSDQKTFAGSMEHWTRNSSSPSSTLMFSTL